jgi:predicted alpha/beta-fold hydrolase
MVSNRASMRAPDRVAQKLHGRVVTGAFVPHPLLGNAHVQTLLPLLRPMPPLELRVERRELPDGDFVDLGWCEKSRGHGPLPQGALLQRQPLAVLLHGLTGGFESKYARGLARQLLARNWRVVILQFRGAGPEPNRLPRHYHHGDTGDLRELLAMLRKAEPDTRLFAVGWSLGANVLLKYLGEEGERAPLTAAVAVCAPFQLQKCAERLRTGFSRIYQRHLMSELQRMILRKNEKVELPIDLEKVARAKDFFDFDTAATAVLNGFRDAHDYYARASSGRYVGGIERPVLAIHARDDPFMTPDIVPAERELPPSVTLELCERGGHVGFCAAGPYLRPRWWLEERIPQFLQQHVA